MILITGGSGYIGSHAAIKFLENGFDVLIFDNLETGHMETVEILQKIGNLKFFKGDLRNISDLKKVFELYSIEAVFHFAAYALVEESVKNPDKYFENNVNGTVNLLNAMVEYDVNKIIFSSSCSVFGNSQGGQAIGEEDIKKPMNPYAQTKFEVEKLLADFDRTHNIKSITLRYFNAAGADTKGRVGECHEPETHLIPNILKSVLNEEKLFEIYGDDYNTPDGTCIRDYVDVEDLAQAHYTAYQYLLKENKSDTFNLGSQSGYSVKQVVNECEKVTGKKINTKICKRREGDPQRLCADSSKAKNILGWEPQKTLQDSIRTTFEFEKATH